MEGETKPAGGEKAMVYQPVIINKALEDNMEAELGLMPCTGEIIERPGLTPEELKKHYEKVEREK